MAWREWRPDLVVYEATDAGAAVVADELGIPSVALAIGNWDPLLGVLPALAAHALEPVDAAPPPWEQADIALAAHPETVPLTYLDSFPLRWRTRERPVPREVLDLKPVAFSLRGRDDHPLGALGRDRPLVYVTLGTVAHTRVDALRAAVFGAASLDVDVLVAAGPDAELGALADLPPNVTVHAWVDQPAVLERAAVAIHHGGSGTLCACAAAGVPQLLLPQLADQPLNAQRVADIGPGRALRRDEVTADAVAAAAAELLADGPHRAECAALADEIAAMPAAGCRRRDAARANRPVAWANGVDGGCRGRRLDQRAARTTDRDWAATMHGVVPHGFAAYARIFHPATRDRPVGHGVAAASLRAAREGVERVHGRAPRDRRRAGDVGRARRGAFGTTMHALAQWHRIVGPRLVEGEDGPRDAAGWRYADPQPGSLEADLVAAVARPSSHTRPRPTTASSPCGRAGAESSAAWATALPACSYASSDGTADDGSAPRGVPRARRARHA